MPIYIDMMGYPVEVRSRPERIISLVPSLSLLLSDFGLGKRLVGVTKFCVHPSELRQSATVIGGTKTLHMDRIDALEPDLIIANKEENNKDDIERLQMKYPVWVSDIGNADQAIDATRMLGEIVAAGEDGRLILQQIIENRKDYLTMSEAKEDSVAYIIWRNPWMAAGAGTFIDAMLKEAGFRNAFEDHSRYPVFELHTLKELGTDRIFLSSEPFPFKESHKQEFLEWVPKEKIHLVDGEMFSWYGSRMTDAYPYFVELRERI